jgi:uncharacterized protein YxeA
MESLLYNKKIRRKYKNTKKKYNKIKITEFNLNKTLIKIIIIIFLLVIAFQIFKRNKKKFFNNILKIKSSNTKVAMCSIAKKENRYIKYFVEFYKKIGYDHIYLFDNNEPGDESINDLEIVKDGIKEGFITVIDYPSKIPHAVTQTQSYYDCYEKYNMEYDWISFYDLDEFLMLDPKYSTIQEYLDNPRLNSCELVKFNWKVYTDNDQLDYVDASPVDRFPNETNYKTENRHVKSTIRGRLDYKKFKRNYSPHSIYSNISACSSSGKTTGWSYYLYPPDFEGGSLNHYVTKSVREFFYKKYKTKVDTRNISEGTKRYLFNYFFSVNRKTKEKVDIFNEIYKTNYK